MVSIYCHEHTTDEGWDCHLGSKYHPAPHQKELFERILETSREELPEECQIDQINTRGFKIVDERGKTAVFVNYYESDTGYRVKIKPHSKGFFEEEFRPLVEQIPVPDKTDTRFMWETVLVGEDLEQPCTICEKTIKDQPILKIKSPYQVQAGEIVEEKLDVDRVDFRACFECADVESRKPEVKKELCFADETYSFYANEDWINNL